MPEEDVLLQEVIATSERQANVRYPAKKKKIFIDKGASEGVEMAFQRYADGIFEGSNSTLDVSLSIVDGKIIDVKILQHRAGGKKYEDMIRPLLGRIRQKQSTDVDVVTGATVSSNALKEAMERALEKALIKEN